MPRCMLEIVEEQIARWQLDVWQRLGQPSRGAQGPAPPDVVAISSAYGSQGLLIADAVGECLSLPIYNHELVTSIADEAHVRPATVESIDESAEGSVDDYIDALTREKSFSQSDYFRALSHAVAALCRRGPCVLVGHGAARLVPAEHRLAVRVTAPPEIRCQTIASAEGIDQHRARKNLKHEDDRQESFLRRFFHVHVESPTIYDLVLNTHHMTVADGAAEIVTAFRLKFTAGNIARQRATFSLPVSLQ